MPEDFESFLRIYLDQGSSVARERAEAWQKSGSVDITQYALMISFIERQSGNIAGSINVIRQSIEAGGEPSPLNIALAEDCVNEQQYADAIVYCNMVIRDNNELIASRFLSTAFLLKSYALLKLGNDEVATAILHILRHDLGLHIQGKFETTETLLAELKKS